MPLILTALDKIPLIQPGDDLADIIQKSLRETGIELQDNDILVIAQKIVSKAERRAVNLAKVLPSQRAMELAGQAAKDARVVELIIQESNEILRLRPGTIVVEHKLGFVCANAGIDHSNVSGDASEQEEWVLLLPQDPDQSAAELRQSIQNRTGRRLGIAIIDSHGRAWRNGTVGVAIGLSGIPALVDKRGEKDLFGYTLRATIIGAVDELAAAASLLMGQVSEGKPVIHVRGFPYPLQEGRLQDILRSKEQDLFR